MGHPPRRWLVWEDLPDRVDVGAALCFAAAASLFFLPRRARVEV